MSNLHVEGSMTGDRYEDFGSTTDVKRAQDAMLQLSEATGNEPFVLIETIQTPQSTNQDEVREEK